MSAREWKPGAVVQHGGERGFIVIRYGDPRIVWENGGWTAAALLAPSPLVVIDPENREDVEGLAACLRTGIESVLRVSVNDYALDSITDKLQAALREFANPRPPKPEEPTGLGAVVEDAEGVRWACAGGDAPWVAWVPGLRYDVCHYDDIDVVRVLSEGVTP